MGKVTITLNKHYRNTRGLHLMPGTQEVSLPLAQYLKDNGHIDSFEVIEPVPDNPDGATESPAGGIPDEGDRDAIKAWLDDKGIEYNGNAKTPTLYALITDYMANNDPA